MPILPSQYIFVYGTLRSEHPEHQRFCSNTLSIQKAELSGELYQLPEGYPILQISPSQILAHASPDPISDWQKASVEIQAIAPTKPAPGRGQPPPQPSLPSTAALHRTIDQKPQGAPPTSIPPLIQGQLLEFPLTSHALEPLDQWECFTPGTPSAYQRYLVRPTQTETNQPLCWVYATTQSPKKAAKLATTTWQRPIDL
ncbi:MAG: gamma-glutamylcyclotransferase [Verrucomicrobiota bacterium]